jgi:protein-disulfide isomerase
MPKHFFKTLLIATLFKTLVIAVLFVTFGGGSAHAEKTMSRADVEKIVSEYIAKNPQLILDSVSAYQKKSQEAHQSDALAKNQDILFKDSNSPEAGNPNGDVTVVEFFDYNCHFCKNAFPTVQSLLEQDKKVRFVFKDFPILGPSSETAAKWAIAAQKQDKYFAFHSAMMNNKEPITDELLEKVAKDAGMDIGKAKKDVDSTATLLQIEKNRSLASKLGLGGTPAFIIGDAIIPGVMSLKDLQNVIKERRENKSGKKG